MEKLRDYRLRHLYGERYDFRRNVLDWDYQVRAPRRQAAAAPRIVFYASFAADDGEVRRGARARGALPPVAPNRRRFRVRRPDVHGPQPNNGHVCTSAFLLAACHHHRRALWHAAVARAHSHVPCVLCQGREKGLTKLRLGFWLDIVNSPYFALGTSCRENGKLDSELFRVDARGRGTEQWRHVGYQLAVVGH